MLGLAFLTHKVAIAGVAAVAVAGSATAVAIPVFAGHPATATTTAAATDKGSATGQHGKMRHRALAVAMLRALRKETRLDRATILQRVAAGQTIAQIAGSKTTAVENDVLAMLRQRLDAAVTRSKITKQHEADILAKAKTRLDQLVNQNLSGMLKHKTGTSGL